MRARCVLVIFPGLVYVRVLVRLSVRYKRRNVERSLFDTPPKRAVSRGVMLDDLVSTSPGQPRPNPKGTPRQATQAGTPRAAGTPRTKSGSGPTPRRGTGTPRTGTPRGGGAASPRAGSTPRTAAAHTPELVTSGPGPADPSWVTKLAAHEAEAQAPELGGTSGPGTADPSWDCQGTAWRRASVCQPVRKVQQG